VGHLRTVVYGASGYAGAELLRLCAGHPHLEVVAATGEGQAGQSVADLYPSLGAAYPTMTYRRAEEVAGDDADVAFLALPHGASQRLVPRLRSRARLVVDLAADFRLRDPGLYPTWYGAEHQCPELLGEAVLGIPELHRAGLSQATLVAAAGCYVTAAALALAPLVQAEVVERLGVVVDAASGVSGAGRSAKATTHFNAVDENFSAYGLLDHRHTPEIEQVTGAQVIFTPHLAPMNRGILATVYARPAVSDPAPLDVLRAAYAGERFVVVDERPPSTKATIGSNCAHLTARHDRRTGWVVALCALDNLVKGAAGQAIQCANVALGVDEGAGLPLAGLYP
jgi:N-acetyl-gamma-glutamyl-phosphate reductase